ncbi:sarcosine oxidase subunit gamma [Sulfitobacter aestuariivivens]|nr:sarcosine oxidase subunit gamma family protein [Sulfitobacter aestuariivivens]
MTIGSVTVVEADLGVLTSLSPVGDGKDFAAALKAAHGLGAPKPGRATGRDGQRCLWFARSEVLLAGPVPDKTLEAHAAVVDQSDGWACVTLSGAGAVDVLARLVPVDFRESIFKRGHTARTLVQHMSASITRTGADTFLILVFRSMAGTLVHELKVAMEAVASRG